MDVTYMVNPGQAMSYLCGSGVHRMPSPHFPAMRIFLREWREWAGLTQEQVAEAVDKSVPTVQRWEAGKRVPGLDDLEMLGKAFGRHPSDLLRSPGDVLVQRSAEDLLDPLLTLIESRMKGAGVKFLLADDARSDLIADARKLLSGRTRRANE